MSLASPTLAIHRGPTKAYRHRARVVECQWRWVCSSCVRGFPMRGTIVYLATTHQPRSSTGEAAWKRRRRAETRYRASTAGHAPSPEGASTGCFASGGPIQRPCDVPSLDPTEFAEVSPHSGRPRTRHFTSSEGDEADGERTNDGRRRARAGAVADSLNPAAGLKSGDEERAAMVRHGQSSSRRPLGGGQRRGIRHSLGKHGCGMWERASRMPVVVKAGSSGDCLV